jgi:hypothetical protein
MTSKLCDYPADSSAYAPSAMSVRSTNVYEEKSLGIFEEVTDDKEEAPRAMDAKVWSKYLAAHARRQLAFGKWRP